MRVYFGVFDFGDGPTVVSEMMGMVEQAGAKTIRNRPGRPTLPDVNRRGPEGNR